MLRKAKFRKQTFEDTVVEREVDVRRRITKLYTIRVKVLLADDRFNKRREEFKNLREYNDYLEDVEEISTPPTLVTSSPLRRSSSDRFCARSPCNRALIGK